MRFFVFLTIALTIWSIEHLYVGWRLLGLPLFETGQWGRALLICMATGFVSYPLGRTFYAIGWHTSGRTLEYFGAVWMGVLFLIFGALFAVDILTVGGKIGELHIDRIRGVAAGVALLAALVAWVGAAFGPRVVEHEVYLSGLPGSADGTTLVHLSDIHLGTILGGGWLDRLVVRVNDLAPDSIVITGDLIDGDAGVVVDLVPQLQRLHADYGVFSILGNHEYYAGRSQSRQLMTDAGFTLLDNVAVEVKPGLWIAGVPDARGSNQTGPGEADLDSTLQQVPKEHALVLLQHAPNDERLASRSGVDLMLNGHTHGGQLWPFHYLVKLAFPHLAGRFEIDGMTQIVSRGTGQWGPPMRLFAPAEIIRITLRSRQEKP